jgi:RimJ/RimL family protein N-acetyltransferase
MTLLESLPTEPIRTSTVIETARLQLRPHRPDDAAALAILFNDRRIADNTASIPHPYTLADAEQFIRTITDSQSSFVITLGGDTIIGNCGVRIAPKSDPEIGYALGVAYWGKGFATEAARALVDHAFDALGYEQLVAGARISNPASRRVLEKCGFQWTRVRLIRVRALNTSVPCDRFRLDRRLWASLRSWGAPRQVA